MCKGTRDDETAGNESFTGEANPQPFGWLSTEYASH